MIKSTYQLTGFEKPKFPKIKGHVKVTLHNCKNGKNEVVEGENIVTNAVRDIFLSNYLGAVDYSKLFGADGIWKKWFGGVLLYEQAHTLNADNYFPPSDAQSHVFAHAGQSSIDPDHDDDSTRGNPVTSVYTFTNNTVKQVWEWGISKGNVPDGRFIRALSLTHSDTGDAGLGSGSYAFSQFVPFESIGAQSAQFRTLVALAQVFAQFDEAHGINFAIGDEGDFGNGHQAFETNKITVNILKMPFSKTGLYQRQYASTEYKDTFTVTISFNVYAMPCFYFDQELKRLWLFTNMTGSSAYSKSVIKYSVIDCLTQTEVDHGTITSDTENLAPLGYGDNTTYYNGGRSVFSGIIFDGTYFYFPTGNNTGAGDLKERLTGYQKINFNNQSDQSTISLYSGEITNFNSAMYAGGLIVGPEFVANGNTMYKCQNAIGNAPFARFGTFANQPNKPSSCYSRFDNLQLGAAAPYSWDYKWILANKMLNTTLFNLPNPVQKTSSQSMTVEYTLQEVGEES